MFRNKEAFSGFSVDDLQRAKAFYADVLGLSLSEHEEMPGLLTLHIAGGHDIVVYEKMNHVAATFTILNFPVPEIGVAVRELQARGIQFEHYEFEDLKTDADAIFRGGGPLIAWFKDPAGNILSVIEQGEQVKEA
jgi:catechol 2,3-dioxygenase-like lactoylglutathione lyase family enzyme